MRKLFLVIVFLVIISFAGINKSYANWSLVDDWSNLSNANGAWSYNEGNTPLPYNVANWPQGEFGPEQTAWANGDSAGTQIPAWLKLVNTPNPSSLYTYDYLIGDVVVHTTYGDHDPANVTWISSFSGYYDIVGGLWAVRRNHKINDWSLYLDDVLLADGTIAYDDSFTRSDPDVFAFKEKYIPEGGVLKLQVHESLLSDHGGDFVGVDLSINEVKFAVVPEPSTYLLFILGLTAYPPENCTI